MISNLVKSKDQQLEEQRGTIESLTAQLDEANRYIQLSKLDPDDPMGADKEEEHR